MSHYCEPAIDKVACTVRMPVELKYKLLQMFPEGGSLKDIVLSLCEEVANDVRLTAKNLKCVRDEIAANYDKRMRLREERKQKSGKGV